MNNQLINIDKVVMQQKKIDSLNDFVRISYNADFSKNIFFKLSTELKQDINNFPIFDFIKYISIRA